MYIPYKISEKNSVPQRIFPRSGIDSRQSSFATPPEPIGEGDRKWGHNEQKCVGSGANDVHTVTNY